MLRWCLFFPFLLEGLYVGNPASSSLLQTGLFSVHNYLITVSSGYVYDTTWDKKLRPDPGSCLEEIEEFQIVSNWSALCCTLLRRFSLYAYLGVSEETMDWNTHQQGGDKRVGSFETKNHFSYSLGAKMILLRWFSTLIGMDIQFFSLPSSKELIEKIEAWYPWNVETSRHYLEIEEWHIALGAVHSFGPFSAYLGGKYGEKIVEVHGRARDKPWELREQNRWGVFTGLSLRMSRGLYVNFEGRWLDEQAFSFAAITAF
ncbi:MAG: hypothetical protein AAGF04_01070 [Chlamydiota bacterium]